MAMVAVGVKIALIAVLVPWVINILSNFLGGFLYKILCWPLFQLVDFVQSIFRRLAGLEPVFMTTGYNTNVKQDDIVLSLITNARVIEIFITMALFAVALLIIATIVQLIRVEYTTEGSKNSKGTVIGAAIKSLAMFVLVPVVCIMGVMVSNTLLKAVDRATSQGGASSISGAIFLAGAAEANVIRSGNRDWVQGEIFLTGGTGQEYKVTDKGIWEVNGEVHDLTDYAGSSFQTKESLANFVDNSFSSPESTALKVGNSTYNYSNFSGVRYFYNCNDMNLIVMLLASGFALTCLFKACFGLVMRLYKVVALFIISPGVIALQPLDGGNAYKAWRKNFIGSVLGAYGTVIALNLFFFLIGIIKNINLFTPASGLGADWNPFNVWAQCIFILVGLLMLNDMSKLISGYIGGEDVLESGTKMAKSVGDTGKKIGGKVAGLAVGGANAFKGMVNKFRSRGIGKVEKEMNKAGKKTREDEILNNMSVSDRALYNSGMLSKAEKEEMLNNTYNSLDKSTQAGIESSVMAAKGKAREDMGYDAEKYEKMSVYASKSAVAKGRANEIFGSMIEDSGLVSLANGLTGGYIKQFGGKTMKNIDDKVKVAMGDQADSIYKAANTQLPGEPEKALGKFRISSVPGEKNLLHNLLLAGRYAGRGIEHGVGGFVNWLNTADYENGTAAAAARAGSAVSTSAKLKQLGNFQQVIDKIEDPTTMMNQNNANFRQAMQQALEAANKGELGKFDEIISTLKSLNNAMRGNLSTVEQGKRDKFINSLEGYKINGEGKATIGSLTASSVIAKELNDSKGVGHEKLTVDGENNLRQVKIEAQEALNTAMQQLTEGAEKAFVEVMKKIDTINFDPKVPGGKIDAAIKKMYKDIEDAAAKAAEEAIKKADQMALAKLIAKFSKK